MTDVDPDRLRGMLHLVLLVQEFLQGVDEQSFLSNRTLIDVTAYRIQHIGEAANKLSIALRERHPQLAWPMMVRMRHVLAHAYDYVDPEVVWKNAAERLDEVKGMYRAELGE